MSGKAVTQATIFSARTHCIEPVIKSLLRLDWPDVTRLWLVNGPDALEVLAPQFSGLPASIKLDSPVFGQIPATAQERRAKKRAICAAWTEMIRRAIELDRDLLFVEDDIVVPTDTVKRLQWTAYNHPAGAVSGITRANKGGWPFYVSMPHGQFHPVLTRLKGNVQVTITGTFCLYLRQDVLRRMKAVNYVPTIKPSSALLVEGKDCHLGIWLAENHFALVVNGDVACEHHVLQPDGKVKVWTA